MRERIQHQAGMPPCPDARVEMGKSKPMGGPDYMVDYAVLAPSACTGRWQTVLERDPQYVCAPRKGGAMTCSRHAESGKFAEEVAYVTFVAPGSVIVRFLKL
jgi:hypothetical protein